MLPMGKRFPSATGPFQGQSADWCDRRGSEGNMKKARTAAGLIAVSIAAAMTLTACSSGGTATNTTPAGTQAPAATTQAPAATTQAPTTTAPAQGGTITVWSYIDTSGANGQNAQAELLGKWKSAFEGKHPGWTVEYSFVAFDQMDSKLIAAASGKTGPDVVMMNGGSTSNLVVGKVLADMSAGWSGFADAGQFPDGVIHKMDGKVYSVQPYVNLLGLYYNKDILDELKLTPPTTQEEMEADMAAAAAAGYEGLTLGGTPDGVGDFHSYPWYTSAGFDYSAPKVEALTAGLQTAANWVAKGWVSKEASTLGNDQAFQHWIAGGVLFMQGGNWNLTNSTAATFKWGTTALPLSNTGGIYLGGEAVGVGAYAKNPDMALAYILDGALGKEGGLAALGVGSIPSRSDLASAPEVKADANIAGFIDEVAQRGANYPPSGVKPDSIGQQVVVSGQAWSSVLAGGDPAAAANTMMTALKPLLNS